MSIPRFVLGHNALIGVHHVDREKDRLKPGLSHEDLEFLTFVAGSGVEGVVLDNHPVAIEAAKFLSNESDISVIPMIPYAQSVVDKASSSGLYGVVKEMASSLGPLFSTGHKSLRSLRHLSLTQIGAHLATGKYLSDYPRKTLGNVCFLHNVVTDLMLGWESGKGISSFARAIRMSGLIPGFVTLNPQFIDEIIQHVDGEVWFMTSVNSAGIQMGPDKEFVERKILANPEINILGMSLLGGGVLEPREEIPRAFGFPAVKSIVIGTSSIRNLSQLLEIVNDS